MCAENYITLNADSDHDPDDRDTSWSSSQVVTPADSEEHHYKMVIALQNFCEVLFTNLAFTTSEVVSRF